MSAPSIQQLLNASRSGGMALMTALEEIRQQNVVARYAVTKILQAPVSRDVALDRLDSWLASVSSASAVKNFALRFTAAGYRAPVTTVPPDVVASAMVAALRDQIGTAISESYGSGTSYSDAERARALAKAEQAVLDLEFAEEAMIRAAEKSGFDVLRRIDADPRAVLASGELQ
jgi:hypothetical protein